MSLAHAYDTVPAYPLGKPLDGRDRYGMTREQACLYRYLVKTLPHDERLKLRFRGLARSMMCSLGNVHNRVSGLVERGWMTVDKTGGYRFVEPIMHFKEPRHG